MTPSLRGENEQLRLATLCSGIGAPEVATLGLGWECLWSAEVDPQASAVLAYHHSESINLGDITKIDGRELERPDVLVFGTPCQSFSVAGKRAGMDDARGVLAFVALGIVDRVHPTWFILENVPGLLSSNAGRDFGAFLRAVDELGYSGAWASPDAQFFGVPQRRERVFFIGHIGDWRYPAAVLSQFSRLCGHPAPSRKTGERAAPTVAGGPPFSRTGNERVECEAIVSHDPACTLTAREYKGPLPEADLSTVVCFDPNQVTSPGNYSNPKAGDPCHPLVSAAPPILAHTLTKRYDSSEDGCGRGTPLVIGFGHQEDRNFKATVESVSALTKNQGLAVEIRTAQTGANGIGIADNVSHTLDSTIQAVAHGFLPGAGAGAGSIGYEKELGPTLRSGCHQYGVHQAMSVRRLTPRECERLQGFEDNYTLVPYKGKPMADGPRYKMIGNSMAVPVLLWLLKNIELVERAR